METETYKVQPVAAIYQAHNGEQGDHNQYPRTPNHKDESTPRSSKEPKTKIYA